MRKTEIELWYNFNFNIMRIVYKNGKKRQLAYQCPVYGWFKSEYKSSEISNPVFFYYEKIGEL